MSNVIHSLLIILWISFSYPLSKVVAVTLIIADFKRVKQRSHRFIHNLMFLHHELGVFLLKCVQACGYVGR